jgi:hypothetical protein
MWRKLNPEDTIRYYSTIVQKVGMIKSTPDQIVKEDIDWRYLNEIRTELPI